MKLLPGSPTPLGATWDGDGVNFAIYSEHATSVELCLFDDSGGEVRAAVPQRTAFVWHAYAPEVRPGQRYGYRVHGPYEPARGLRFNAEAVLLDPYAKAVDGVERWDEGCFAYELGAPEGDALATTKPQFGAPRGVVVDSEFDWEGDEPLRTPLHRSVIYEAHVRGLTKLHLEVPEALRGTYAGVAHPAVIRYLGELGITAIELMPTHAFVDEKILVDRGLRNYWGDSTIGFFAPDVRYRAPGPSAAKCVSSRRWSRRSTARGRSARVFRGSPSAPIGDSAAEGRSPDDVARPIPLLVEKILEPGEQLRAAWPVDGTTGYDFTSAVEGLWVDPASGPALTTLYRGSPATRHSSPSTSTKASSTSSATAPPARSTCSLAPWNGSPGRSGSGATSP